MKQRYVIVPVLAGILAYWTYDWFSHPLKDSIDKELVYALEQLHSLSISEDIELLSLRQDRSNPESVYESLPNDVHEVMKRLDLQSAYFAQRDDGTYGASFYVERLLGFLRPQWYYVYESDGITEEEVVPSLAEALERKEYPYHYCEKADLENWFFCTSNDL